MTNILLGYRKKGSIKFLIEFIFRLYIGRKLKYIDEIRGKVTLWDISNEFFRKSDYLLLGPKPDVSQTAIKGFRGKCI